MQRVNECLKQEELEGELRSTQHLALHVCNKCLLNETKGVKVLTLTSEGSQYMKQLQNDLP